MLEQFRQYFPNYTSVDQSRFRKWIKDWTNNLLEEDRALLTKEDEQNMIISQESKFVRASASRKRKALKCDRESESRESSRSVTADLAAASAEEARLPNALQIPVRLQMNLFAVVPKRVFAKNGFSEEQSYALSRALETHGWPDLEYIGHGGFGFVVAGKYLGGDEYAIKLCSEANWVSLSRDYEFYRAKSGTSQESKSARASSP